MKHFFIALVNGFVWVFFLGLVVVAADRLFGIKLEDSPDSPSANVLAWFFLVVFWIAAIGGGYLSYQQEVKDTEAEVRRRQSELADLREQVKKSVLDELRKGSSTT